MPDKAFVVRIMGNAQGAATPLDDKWVLTWNPHVEFGRIDVTVTSDLSLARRFGSGDEAIAEWRTVSDVQPVRPDGRPNRPLGALVVRVEEVSGDAHTAPVGSGRPFVDVTPQLAPEPNYDVIMMEIGAKGELSDKARRQSALAYRTARRFYPAAKLGFTVGGYDDDPRELYDIPETKAYIRAWAHDAGLTDWRQAMKLPWVDPGVSLGMLQLCGAFADDSPIVVNTPSGRRRT